MKLKKNFITFLICWVASLALFNVVTFVTPNEINGVSKFDSLFWVSYVFITLFFLAQLVIVYIASRADSLQQAFYNISLFTTSVSALIMMLVVGGVCMAVVPIPAWVGIIACSVVLVFNIFAVAKTVTAIRTVSNIDRAVKSQTLFVKMLTADAQTLLDRSAGTAMQKNASAVYDAIRYSDPMSDSALAALEEQISHSFSEFSAAVDANSADEAETSSRRLLALIAERNTKCRMLK